MIDHRDSAVRIAKTAWFTSRQLQAVGVTHHSKEDIEQELWMVWCKARDTFDETLGVPFEAYLVNGMKRHLQFVLKRKVFQRIEDSWAKSLDAPVGDEDNRTIGDTIADTSAPTVTLEEEDHFAWFISQLSDQAATFARLLKEQPAPLLDELDRFRDRSEYAKEQHVANMCFSSITTSMVFKLMGCSRPERTRILAEIRELAEKHKRKAA
jgi:hypothetical protein